jgi:DNA-binding beta-propeller fold protein YncE
VISDRKTGNGSLFNQISGLALDTDGNIVVVDTGGNSVIGVEILTGDRDTITGLFIGSGPILQFPRAIAVEDDGNILVFDSFNFSLFRVDPINGNRTVLVDVG